MICTECLKQNHSQCIGNSMCGCKCQYTKLHRVIQQPAPQIHTVGLSTRPEPLSAVTLETTTAVSLSIERYNQLINLEKRIHDWRLGWDKSDEYRTLLQMVSMALASHLSEGEGLIGPVAATEPYQEAALTALIVILRGVESPMALPELLETMGKIEVNSRSATDSARTVKE